MQSLKCLLLCNIDGSLAGLPLKRGPVADRFFAAQKKTAPAGACRIENRSEYHGFKEKPVTGMKDILPAEMEIRDYVLAKIKETYRSFGFSAIETPCVEHIENLTSKQGGDNEKLIFKILKRGEKLNLETAREESDVVDGGLRYDLTLPLSRYYANNSANLPVPSRLFRWEASGVLTAHRRDASDSLCSATLIS